MNLYLQVLTRVQTVRAIDLIHTPFLLCPDGDRRARANLARGQVMRIAMSRLDNLSKKLVRNRFSKTEVIYDIKAIKLRSKTLKVKLVKGVLTPYPTSALWLPSDRFVVRDKASSFRQVHANGLEQAGSRFNLRDEPVSFDMVFTFDTSRNKESVLDDVAECLADIMERVFADLRVFGCCDAGPKDFQIGLLRMGGPNFEHQEMMFLRRDKFQKFGRMFRTLHSVMFGSAKVCLGIASCLGKHARVIKGGGQSEFAVIRLSPSSALTSLENCAKHWLIQ
jgi:hypothetical protein